MKNSIAEGSSQSGDWRSLGARISRSATSPRGKRASDGSSLAVVPTASSEEPFTNLRSTTGTTGLMKTLIAGGGQPIRRLAFPGAPGLRGSLLQSVQAFSKLGAFIRGVLRYILFVNASAFLFPKSWFAETSMTVSVQSIRCLGRP